MPLRRALVGCEMSGEVREALAATGYWDEVWSADILPTEKLADVVMVPGQGTVFNGRTHPEHRTLLTGHYQGDVLDLFKPEHPVNAARFIDLQCNYVAPEAARWTLFIGHPPCDHLSQAGAVYWKRKDAARGGDGRMQEGAAFFMKMVNAPARYVAVENPVGVMGLPKQACYYRRPDQVTQPWMHGDPLVKRTCLWLENLPLLVATHGEDDYPELQRIATGGGSHRTDWKKTGRSNNGHEDRRGRAFRKIERSRTPPGFARAMATQWTAFIETQEKTA